MAKQKNNQKISIYTVDDVLQILDVSPSTLWRLKRKVGIKTEKNKRKTRYSSEELYLLTKTLLEEPLSDEDDNRMFEKYFLTDEEHY
ncbi:MAG: helix-turn-helix domain-containing protein [Bacteroidales bacterium]|jgi:DNA-binding transcriptional MerR regulator|nr:helix-turn-helix domain-containing protein [Bacteroidales bacterium]